MPQKAFFRVISNASSEENSKLSKFPDDDFVCAFFSRFVMVTMVKKAVVDDSSW